MRIFSDYLTRIANVRSRLRSPSLSVGRRIGRRFASSHHVRSCHHSLARLGAVAFVRGRYLMWLPFATTFPSPDVMSTSMKARLTPTLVTRASPGPHPRTGGMYATSMFTLTPGWSLCVTSAAAEMTSTSVAMQPRAGCRTRSSSRRQRKRAAALLEPRVLRSSSAVRSKESLLSSVSRNARAASGFPRRADERRRHRRASKPAASARVYVSSLSRNRDARGTRRLTFAVSRVSTRVNERAI